jgi:hypothetical protein
MSSGTNRLLNRVMQRYPYLFFILAAVVVSNNVLKYSPGQVMTGFGAVVVPIVLVCAGIGGYAWKAYEKKNTAKTEETEKA